ncbi:MAG TPA: hypothetical protein VNJ02_19765 [Vicinamibacterales bacterium]|nr:hypothetical protein [Vicinamibacterales bacterium]
MPDLTPTLPSVQSRRYRWISRIAMGLAIVVAFTAVGLYVYADRLIESRLRPATIELLERRFDSKVELASLKVRLLPTLAIRGEGLTLRHQGRTDIPPVITIRAFTIESTMQKLWDRHINRVHLEGLEIMIPPRRRKEMPKLQPSGADTPDHQDQPDVYIHELLTEDSLLSIMPKTEGKDPRVFQLRKLKFEELQFSKATPFEADLSNPTPDGEIHVVGAFGPWHSGEPSLTPIDGTFVFDADLASIKGIGGVMHAEGTFGGPLEFIKSSGKTRTEGFYLSSGGQKFPLTVDYDAIVDGTNGDTTLERVDGQIGQSRITANGDIVRVEGKKGRRITLNTAARGGRLEDFIKLTTKVKNSPLTGIVNVKAKLDIPPGEAEVIERIDLDGTFDVAAAQFTSETIQNRIDELSRRGVGRPTDASIDNVASNLRGSFRLNDAHLNLRSLTFKVDGAEVRLAGGYGVQSEQLNFAGELRLEAKASKTQTGWKSLVLKMFDPLLDGNGAGTLLPISVTGTRDQPKFQADLKKALFPGKKKVG